MITLRIRSPHKILFIILILIITTHIGSLGAQNVTPISNNVEFAEKSKQQFASLPDHCVRLAGTGNHYHVTIFGAEFNPDLISDVNRFELLSDAIVDGFLRTSPWRQLISEGQISVFRFDDYVGKDIDANSNEVWWNPTILAASEDCHTDTIIVIANNSGWAGGGGDYAVTGSGVPPGCNPDTCVGDSCPFNSTCNWDDSVPFTTLHEMGHSVGELRHTCFAANSVEDAEALDFLQRMEPLYFELHQNNELFGQQPDREEISNCSSVGGSQNLPCPNWQVPEILGWIEETDPIFGCYAGCEDDSSLNRPWESTQMIMCRDDETPWDPGFSPPGRERLHSEVLAQIEQNSNPTCYDIGQIPFYECQVLQDLTYMTDFHGNWFTSRFPCDEWEGIQCKDGQISSIILSGKEISGVIPLSIDSLYSLEVLDLRDNMLSGEIPAALSHLPQLRVLDLGNNVLTEVAWHQFIAFQSLEDLRIDGNTNLSGCIPQLYINQDLKTFWYDNTKITEPSNWEFQEWLQTIPDLKRTGVPCTPDLTCNDVFGIPLAECNSLAAFFAATNQLGPEIVDWFTIDDVCKYWTGITCAGGHIAELRLPGYGIEGYIPPEIEDLKQLAALDLSGNQLGSSIPQNIGQMSELRELELSENVLIGEIPAQIGQLSELTHLGLASNQLSGYLPANLANLSMLESLNVADNNLNGNIPSNISGLLNLKYLRINENPFKGCIPGELDSLFLEQFWFDETDLLEPREDHFQAWLASIKDLHRTGNKCPTALLPVISR
ncbi:MAG: leucine-rich repeat domain-containing protein [Candidatus Promineifilaceae bacterium]|nr:leucine-rich repeat domain-containing protein [Candidatus Promineifilaceae bacterium]